MLKAPHNERKGQDRTKAGIYIGNHAGNENKEKAPKKSATGGAYKRHPQRHFAPQSMRYYTAKQHLLRCNRIATVTWSALSVQPKFGTEKLKKD